MAGRGQVVDQTGFGPFGVCPVTLPENMTVDSTGEHRPGRRTSGRFLNYLHSEKGVTEVDLVGHSMGGLYSARPSGSHDHRRPGESGAR